MDLIAGIAGALSELRRGPGKNESWIEGAAQTLERNQPDVYGRAVRRIGFARKLAEFAELSQIDQETLTVGLFFNELLAGAEDGAPKASRAWSEYLMMNDLWLDRAYAVTSAAQTEDWEEVASMINVIAKLAVEFDGALDRKSRPLQVLQALRSSAETPVLEHATTLLWSEEGQKLCDYHLRHRGQAYKIGPKEIRQSLEALRATARTSVERQPVANLRLVTNNRQERAEAEAPRDEAEDGYPEEVTVASLGNFEKRRQALRAGSARGSGAAPPRQAERRVEPDVSPEPEPEGEPDVAEQNGAIDDGVAVEDLWLPGRGPDAQRQKDGEPAQQKAVAEPERPASRRLQMERTEPEEPKRKIDMEPQEEPMVTSRATSRYEATGVQDLVGGLQDMRDWFDRLRRTAAEGDALLSQIAPQLQAFAARLAELEEVAARIDEVEEMVDRWKGIKGATTRAA